ncbi:MAG: hypothetical protein KBG84_08340 [Planctomycetes bacterium]|nr:hypothetical protein [Planctomycetota bacterium]
MQTVETHAGEWMSRELARCKSSLLVSSPYLNAGFVKLCRDLPAGGERFLLTRTKVMDFARKSSDLGSLVEMAGSGFSVFSNPAIHAKIYVVDRRTALVTSANATHAGLWRNLEAGIATDDPASVKTLANCVTDAFGKRKECTEWTADKLSALSPIVETIRKRLPTIDVVVPDTTTTTESDSIDTNTAVEISTQLTGWKRLVWECVLSLKREEFDLADIYAASIPRAKLDYPAQKDPEAGIRRELQALRNLGLIEFVDNKGHYRAKVRSV